ncbi:MAG: GlsB/YeaQ/YmgE family stress response membrane protein [Rhodobacteraceae bacterium]|nr:GlsB/YeaQ/YmgE family stress response membrane protein [Paracoccaceae bacterium]
MGLGAILATLIVGAVAGWLAALIVRGEGMGLVLNIALGIVGAFVAGFVLPAIGFGLGGGMFASIVHATIGAVLLLLVIRLFKRA